MSHSNRGSGGSLTDGSALYLKLLVPAFRELGSKTRKYVFDLFIFDLYHQLVSYFYESTVI